METPTGLPGLTRFGLGIAQTERGFHPWSRRQRPKLRFISLETSSSRLTAHIALTGTTPVVPTPRTALGAVTC